MIGRAATALALATLALASPASAAKLVRVRDGERLVTDGPVRQTEDVVGFDILECASMEEAIEIAAQHRMARAGRIELREFWPFEG